MTATTAEDSRERDRQQRPARRKAGAVRTPNRKGRSPIFDAPTPHGLVLRYLALFAVLLISIGPMLWELSTSLKSKAEDVFTQNIQLLPHHPTLGNYGEVWDRNVGPNTPLRRCRRCRVPGRSLWRRRTGTSMRPR